MSFLPRRSASLIILFALSGAPLLSGAQTYPSRPVTMVVPYPPGGTADILARTVGQKLSEKLGQPVVVENKAGAGTAIGTRYVAEAAPDGYTLLLGTVSSHAINPAMSQVGYDPVRDFAAVASLGSIPFVLVARPDAPYQTLPDLIAAAKKQPGSISYASAGPGTSNHLAGEMLAGAAGIKLLHVPYRGSAPALGDVLAGHVPLMFDLQTTSAPYVRQGKLKALAVTGAQRSALLPNVPTAAESGLPGYEVSAWFALFAPAKVPRPVQKRLSDDLAAVLAAPDMVQKLRELGAEPDARSPAEFTSYVRSEAEKYEKVVKDAGLSR
ncbi:Bug family tripartite tricarboxylate transporter substrate binding protein [Ottowia thiooxydans]|uniref:Bug family tripartite tricarboxylate transporter substrate binding protein n=1 Tax=Ottowia thiooxydans TaxID=219182 RepID=UPI000411D05D|nr:tripartite tricarboxylate transporter substrate binding protein [Ottowia thiooxydans]